MPSVNKNKKKPVAKKSPSKSSSDNENEGDVAVVSGQLAKKIQKQKQKAKETKAKGGVVFIKHLPHGFFEQQLKKYFEQFGNVNRLRLVRSARTGGSKGFAFIEFAYPEVAQVAAETMNNYLMFNKVVKAVYIPPEKQNFNFFKSSVRKVKNKVGKEIYVSYKTAAIQRKVQKHNDWSDEVYQKRTAAKLGKIKKLNEKYAHLGIDFNNVVLGAKHVTNGKSNKEETAGSSELKTKKRKQSATDNESDASSKKQTQKKMKKEIELTDLLGDTINDDDSDDEEYKAESSENEEDYDDLIESESDEEYVKKIVKKGSNKLSKQKIKKDIQLEDLLGDTINEDDSDDEEFVANTSENESDEEQEDDEQEDKEDEEDDNDSTDEANETVLSLKKKIKSGMKVEDLLGATLDEDSDDEDFEATLNNTTSSEECDSNLDDKENESDSDISDDNTDISYMKNKKKPKKKVAKHLQSQDRLEEYIKRKPHTGGIQKHKKQHLKKKSAITANKLKLEETKKMAKPLKVISKNVKKFKKV